MDEFCPWTLPMNLECEFVHRLRSYDAVEIIIMLILPDPTRTHLSPSYARLFRSLGEGDGSSIQSLHTLPGGISCPIPLPMMPTSPFPNDCTLTGSLSPEAW